MVVDLPASAVLGLCFNEHIEEDIVFVALWPFAENEAFASVTMAHIRSHGCRDLVLLAAAITGQL